MRRALSFVLTLPLIACGTFATGAEITVGPTAYRWSPHLDPIMGDGGEGGVSCSIHLSGEIGAGDADRLADMVRELNSNAPGIEPFHVACLDSGGGSFFEGAKIAFMGGVGVRQMAPDATLQFHAPFLQLPSDYGPGGPPQVAAQDIEESFRTGTESIAALLALRSAYADRWDLFLGTGPIFPASLLAKVLEHHGDDYFTIETIDHLGTWGITLSGVTPRFTQLREGAELAESIPQMCSNVVRWDRYLDYYPGTGGHAFDPDTGAEMVVGERDVASTIVGLLVPPPAFHYEGSLPPGASEGIFSYKDIGGGQVTIATYEVGAMSGDEGCRINVTSGGFCGQAGLHGANGEWSFSHFRCFRPYHALDPQTRIMDLIEQGKQ
jgi:hypothetical protein